MYLPATKHVFAIARIRNWISVVQKKRHEALSLPGNRRTGKEPMHLEGRRKDDLAYQDRLCQSQGRIQVAIQYVTDERNLQQDRVLRHEAHCLESQAGTCG